MIMSLKQKEIKFKPRIPRIPEYIIPSTDMIQLTLTLKMTTAQVVETSVTVNNNRPIQDYVHPDDQTQSTFDSNKIEPQQIHKAFLSRQTNTTTAFFNAMSILYLSQLFQLTFSALQT